MSSRTRLLRLAVAVVAATLWAILSSNAQTGASENIVLGRPTADSIAVSVLAGEGAVVFAEYGEMPGNYSDRTSVVESSTDNIAEIAIEGGAAKYQILLSTELSWAGRARLPCG